MRFFTTRPSFARCCTVLLWLVMLAVPLQGFAAAAMVHCNKNSSSAALDVQQHPHSHMSQTHQHLVAGVEIQSHSANIDVGHSCSACAVCCHLLALANTPLPVKPVLLANDYSPDLPMPALGIAPRLSKKPPRF